jgi:predicted Fe-Mo cluster-binding NifX family protein
MKIAIATSNYLTVAGHAGQAKHWLLFDCRPGLPIEEPRRIELSEVQLMHHFNDDGPHPLDGVQVMIAASAGDGFLRHMHKRGADVLLTGESNPDAALRRVIDGEVLPDPRWNPTLLLRKLRDLFSRH